MTKNSFFIHIGAPKTATTTLQRNVFPLHPDIDYIEWSDFYKIGDFKRIFYSDSIYYNIDEMKKCQNQIGNFLTTFHKNTILSSCEHLVHDNLDVGFIAEKICFLFNNPKIIITTRNQHTAMESYYKWQLRKLAWPTLGGLPILSYDKFVNNSLNDCGIRGTYNNFTQKMDYGYIIKKYLSLEKQEDIGIFLFEQLESDPKEFSREFSKFINVNDDIFYNLLSSSKTNVSINSYQKNYYLIKSLILPPSLLHLERKFSKGKKLTSIFKKGKGIKINASQETISMINDRYSEGNSYLISKFDIDLRRHGYPL